jgi:hypothetical protein
MVVQWTTHSLKATAAAPITLTGCFYNDTRTLIVIEL